MKRSLSFIVALLILAALATFSLAENNTADATTAATQPPMATTDPGIMGTVTAVDESAGTITITGMLLQQMGQPGNGQQPSGNAPSGDAPSGNGNQGGGPAGNAPAGNGGQDGNGGQGGTPPSDGNGQGMQQTAYTLTLTSSTVITSGETQETLTLSDLSEGTQVLVTVSGDETAGYTALTITTQTQQQS